MAARASFGKRKVTMNLNNYYWIEESVNEAESIKAGKTCRVYRYRSFVNGSCGPWRRDETNAHADGLKHAELVTAILHYDDGRYE